MLRNAIAPILTTFSKWLLCLGLTTAALLPQAWACDEGGDPGSGCTVTVTGSSGGSGSGLLGGSGAGGQPRFLPGRPERADPVEVATLGKVNLCSQDPRNANASTVSTEIDELRIPAVNQVLTAAFPNVVNTRSGKSNKLRVTVQYSDGGTEEFEHVTMSSQQWRSMGPPAVGDGVAGSACKAQG